MSRIDFVTGAPEKYMPLVQELTLVEERVERLVAGYTARDLQRQPSEGEWSAGRVLAHMISYAIHNGEFIRQIAWMTDPRRRPWDEDAEVAQQGWANKNGTNLLEALREPLADTIELLSGTPDAQWGRPGTVPGRGRRSLRQQVRAHLDHLEEHMVQLEQMLKVPEAAAVN
jgi:DinB superfamily